jgi:hypothetical protein
MNDHTLRLIRSIASACSEYRDENIDLSELQARVEPVVSALDEDLTEAQAALRHLLAQLECIRFMYGEHEQRPEVLREIDVVHSALPEAFGERTGATDSEGR